MYFIQLHEPIPLKNTHTHTYTHIHGHLLLGQFLRRILPNTDVILNASCFPDSFIFLDNSLIQGFNWCDDDGSGGGWKVRLLCKHTHVVFFFSLLFFFHLFLLVGG